MHLGRRWTMIAAGLLVVLSAPLWLPRTCPLQRLFLTADKRVLIELKNRVELPGAADFDLRATLRALLEPGADRQRWSERQAARIEGFVVNVQTAGMELANCLSFTRRDIHIDVALTADAPSRERFILEVTPPMRDWAATQGLDWSIDAIRPLIGRRVRFEGWLMFDREHDEESEHSRPGQPGNWRATGWELHPVTAIELLE